MKLRRQLRVLVELPLICLAWCTIPMLPRRAVVGLAAWCGRAAFALAPGLRRVALANLDTAYGDSLSAAEKRRIVVQSHATSALLMLDLFWFSWFCRRRLTKWVTIDPSFLSALTRAPLAMVTGHLGNWEVAGLAVALHGVPLLSVAARVKSPVAEFVMRRVRRQTGQKIVLRKGAMRAMVRELRQKGRIALLIDQNVHPNNGGVFVNFFGLPVPVSPAASVLCARTGAAAVVVCFLPDERGHYLGFSRSAMTVGEGGVPESEATQRMTDELEGMIRENPGRWLWAYKRWRYVPPGADRSRYPFYAEPWEPRAKTGDGERRAEAEL